MLIAKWQIAYPQEKSMKHYLRFAILLLVTMTVQVFAQRGAPAGPPPAAKAVAPVDLTGYWVSIVTEDWRFRMVLPKKGDNPSIPVNAEGKRLVDSWDPAKDAAAGEQCKAFGAGNIMRMPGRLHEGSEWRPVDVCHNSRRGSAVSRHSSRQECPVQEASRWFCVEARPLLRELTINSGGKT